MTPPRATRDHPAPDSFSAPVSRPSLALLGRGLASIQWLLGKVRRSLRRKGFPGISKSHPEMDWYEQLYRGIGDQALQFCRPGERVPDLMLYDLEGKQQPLSRCWERKPALLVTMSLSCGRTRRHARDLQRLARRFAEEINTVTVYVVEAHPVDAPSPYRESIWMTTKNQIAGLHCSQPQTLEARIELAKELKRRFDFSHFVLVDAMDNRAWRAFGSAPNLAILIDSQGRIVFKHGWFEPKGMQRAIAAL